MRHPICLPVTCQYNVASYRKAKVLSQGGEAFTFKKKKKKKIQNHMDDYIPKYRTNR